jgi:hypothetical protein
MKPSDTRLFKRITVASWDSTVVAGSKYLPKVFNVKLQGVRREKNMGASIVGVLDGKSR